MNKKQGGNFAALSPTDFIAAVTQHIFDKGFLLVRYYGWYSHKAPGRSRQDGPRRKPKTLLKAMSRILRPPRPSGGGSSPRSGRPTR